MRKKRTREFSAIVERDEAGYYVASVPELPGCHAQARSLDKLRERIREAIELCSGLLIPQFRLARRRQHAEKTGKFPCFPSRLRVSARV